MAIWGYPMMMLSKILREVVLMGVNQWLSLDLLAWFMKWLKASDLKDLMLCLTFAFPMTTDFIGMKISSQWSTAAMPYLQGGCPNRPKVTQLFELWLSQAKISRHNFPNQNAPNVRLRSSKHLQTSPVEWHLHPAATAWSAQGIPSAAAHLRWRGSRCLRRLTRHWSRPTGSPRKSSPWEFARRVMEQQKIQLFSSWESCPKLHIYHVNSWESCHGGIYTVQWSCSL